jgi:hypothetical protein
LVVALLYSAKAMARDVGAQPMGFWGLWYQYAAGVVVGGRNGCVVDVVRAVDEGFGYVAAAVEAVDEGFDRAELHAYVTTDEEYQECIAPL